MIVAVRRRLRRALLVAAACTAASMPAAGQAPGASVYVPLDDIAYRYADALMARGSLRALSSLERPYTASAMRTAALLELSEPGAGLSSARRGWLEALTRAVAKHEPMPDDGGDSALVVTVGGAAGLTWQGSGRRELMLTDGRDDPAIGVELRGAMRAGRVVAAARALADQRLEHDPEFTGKKDRSVVGRIEDGYVAAQWRFGELFFGRTARNWGPPSQHGLQLGHYAYSYDHLLGRLGGERLRLTTLFARLEAMRLGADSVAQRYFAAHRLSGRWGALEWGLTESITFGGVDRGLSLAYLNPLNIYDVSQYNEGETGNVAYGADISWRSRALGVLAAQLLVDDVQVDECTPNCEEPPSYGLTASAEGLPLLGDQRWFASYTRVSNLAYRTPQPWEQYSWLDVGLGRGFSDYDEARAGLDVAVIPRTTLRLYAALRRQGEGDYRLPYPAPSEYAATPAFLAGTVTRVSRIAVSGATMWGALAEATWDVGHNRVKNPDDARGFARSGVAARVRVAVAPGAWVGRYGR